MHPALHRGFAAAYVSSATNSVEQLAEQERRVREAAARDGYAIDEHLIFREERRGEAEGAVSQDPSRPVLSSVLARLAAGRLACTRLYVSDPDRLSRGSRYNREVRALLGSYGVAVVSTAHPLMSKELERVLERMLERTPERRVLHGRGPRRGRDMFSPRDATGRDH